MFGNTGTCLCLRSPAGELGQGPSLVRRVHGHTQPAQDLRVSDPHHRPNINMQRISGQLVGQEKRSLVTHAQTHTTTGGVCLASKNIDPESPHTESIWPQ